MGRVKSTAVARGMVANVVAIERSNCPDWSPAMNVLHEASMKVMSAYRADVFSSTEVAEAWSSVAAARPTPSTSA